MVEHLFNSSGDWIAFRVDEKWLWNFRWGFNWMVPVARPS